MARSASATGSESPMQCDLEESSILLPASAFSFPSQKEQQKRQRQPGPVFFTSLCTTLADTGYELFIYDVVEHRVRFARLNPSFELSSRQCITLGASMYIIGTGRRTAMSRSVFEVPLDLGQSPRLIPHASIRIARAEPGLAQYNGEHIYVMGGETEERHVWSCEKYDAKRDVWTAAPPLKKNNCVEHTFNIGHYIYVIGSCWNMCASAAERLDVLDEEKGWTEFGSDKLVWSVVSWLGMIQVAPDTLVLYGSNFDSSVPSCYEMRVIGENNMHLKPAREGSVELGKEMGREVKVFGGKAYVMTDVKQLYVYSTRTWRWAVKHTI